ncbi:helix-turn-helix transcriptional regulator [Kiritimatiellota bacterium B12222]|nr:helix-turn-helix transcriptional regulator [Kiritimatiellota bacterium B12222]
MDIKKERIRLGLSQELLAVKAGMNPSTYGRLERCGGKQVNQDTARKLAEALEVDVEELFPEFHNLRSW